jgi:hypothetical protein
MDNLEAWLDFRHGEKWTESKPLCYHCGEECSGDVSELIEIIGVGSNIVAICDNPDLCKGNLTQQ